MSSKKMSSKPKKLKEFKLYAVDVAHDYVEIDEQGEDMGWAGDLHFTGETFYELNYWVEGVVSVFEERFSSLEEAQQRIKELKGE